MNREVAAANAGSSRCCYVAQSRSVRDKQRVRTAKKVGTRRLFYGALGLLLAGLLLAIGALNGLPLLMVVGGAGMLGAGALQMAWLVRKIG